MLCSCECKVVYKEAAVMRSRIFAASAPGETGPGVLDGGSDDDDDNDNDDCALIN